MNLRATMARVVLAMATVVLLAACAHHDRDEEALAGLPSNSGYYEVPREDGVYVVGSLASADLVQAGKPLPMKISSYTAEGRPLFFEADGRGLEQRLTAEYERRHPHK